MANKIVHVNIDLNNAKWVYESMHRVLTCDQGLNRTLRRAFDWINWGDGLYFVTRLAPYTVVHPADGQGHEYSDHQYTNYRATARNRTVSVDDEPDETKFRLINDYQFQLRLIDWAEDVVKGGWFNHLLQVQRQPNHGDLPEGFSYKHLELSYATSSDADGSFFYVPVFKLNLPQDWETFWTAKQKKCMAGLVGFLAVHIGNMYDNLRWLPEEDSVSAQRVLANLAEADELVAA